jgi:hypothetical protein
MKDEKNISAEKAEEGYLRYGEPPASGISKTIYTDRLEKGISVVPAFFYEDGTYRIDVDRCTSQTLWTLVQIDARDIYRIWGKLVGSGTDGEPVLDISSFQKLDKSLQLTTSMVAQPDAQAVATEDDLRFEIERYRREAEEVGEYEEYEDMIDSGNLIEVEI